MTSRSNRHAPSEQIKYLDISRKNGKLRFPGLEKIQTNAHSSARPTKAFPNIQWNNLGAVHLYLSKVYDSESRSEHTPKTFNCFSNYQLYT